MCLNPGELADGTQVLCRKCWQCRYDRVNDWVGRCIAESRTAVATHAITLTYGRVDDEGNAVEWDGSGYGQSFHPRAAVLTYSDVQKWLKYLRVEGYPLRYFVAGENGSKKGRAHWHVVAFWQKKVPPHELERNFNEKHWRNGFSFWAERDFTAFRYNMKYILKNYDDEYTQSHTGQSRVPPLGAAYFAQHAVEMARQGLPPDAHYTFPEATRENGERYRFRLADRSLELFYEAWRDAWDRFHPGRPYPSCDLTDKFENRPIDGRTFAQQPYMRMAPLTELDIERLRSLTGDAVPYNPLVPDAGVGFDEKLNALVYEDRSGRKWHWWLEKGVWQWLDLNGRARGKRYKQEWSLAVKAASETAEPWRIIPGSKPRRQRPRVVR